MDYEARKIFIVLTLLATTLGASLGMWGWLATGSSNARLMVIVCLAVFAPVYYVFEYYYIRRIR